MESQTINSHLKFSIIIPARNEEVFISRCLDSIIIAGKPYPHQLEIIVAIKNAVAGSDLDVMSEVGQVWRLVFTEECKILAQIANGERSGDGG